MSAFRQAAGATVVGHKIGLTSLAVQQQLGVDRPDFGLLLGDMGYAAGAEVPIERLLQPRVEAEIAFVLADDLAEGTLDVEQVRGAVAYAVAALEIVDSRISDWDISFGDTVADNASSGLYVLGDRQVPLAHFKPVDAEMSMSIDGEVVSIGNGAACLGDPLAALVWLARTAREVGPRCRPVRSCCPERSARCDPCCWTTGPRGHHRPRVGHHQLHWKGQHMTARTKVAIIGSGNIGTDLMIKVLRLSQTLEVGAMVGIDADSDGLARARRFNVSTTHKGVDGLIALPGFDDIEIVFDATSAGRTRRTRPASRRTASASST